MAVVNTRVLIHLVPITASVMKVTAWRQTANHAFVSYCFELMFKSRSRKLLHTKPMLILAVVRCHNHVRLTHSSKCLHHTADVMRQMTE